MSKRNYNVFFNTHTISGIVISVGLYIIFFAGSFSFFKDEIEFWEKGEVLNKSHITDVDCDKIISKLDKTYNLHARDISVKFSTNRDYASFIISGTKDTIANPKGKDSQFFYLNVKNFSEKTYAQNYNLGFFLYRLHFLDPIYYPIGRYSAGLIALFFVFAIITGTIVHWRKIGSNFFSLNPKSILKKLWTDSHTALGVIGLPFQFIYGITGATFIIGILTMIPANFLFEGDQAKMIETLSPENKEYNWKEASDDEALSINSFIKKTDALWSDFNINKLKITNYGGSNVQYIIKGKLDTDKRFVGLGKIIFDGTTGEIISKKDPNELNYLEDIRRVWVNLHYANFGGITLKIIYFILGIVTCFVIITGVLIWIEARNKKSMTLKQRLYTAKVGHIYLAICLSMFPVTALSFIFSRLTYGIFEDPETAIYWFYFSTWALFTLFYRFKRNNYFTNKNSILIGSIFGFMIPIVNGFSSGNWFWKTFLNHQHEIFTIDAFWFILSTIALVIYFKIKPSINDKSAFTKNPIDYKEIKKLKKQEKLNQKNNPTNILTMKTKIITLWILILFGYIFHHIYGLATIFFNQSVFIEGSTGITPMWAHQWRILMEGTAFLFVILTLSLSSKTFKLISLIWGVIVALFNCYHVTEELIGNPSDISKVFILLLTAVASILLVLNIRKWYAKND